MECGKCGDQSEFVEFGGNAYCVKCGCAQGTAADFKLKAAASKVPTERSVSPTHPGRSVLSWLLGVTFVVLVAWTWDTPASAAVRRALLFPFDVAFQFAFWVGAVGVGVFVGLQLHARANRRQPPPS